MRVKRDLNLPKCSMCRESIVEPFGPKNAKAALWFFEPTFDDLKYGQLLTQKTSQPAWKKSWSVGDIVRNELALAGLFFDSLYVTSLNKHLYNDACFGLHFCQCLDELASIPVIAVFGSDLTDLLWDKPVTAIAGVEQASSYFENTVLYPIPNPGGLVGSGTIGEFRLSIRKFANKVKMNG